MNEVTISKSIHRVLSALTGESRADVAVELAAKDLLRLKLKETRERVKGFETRYRMGFAQFKEAWDAGKIANKHSHEVERDYWEWEAATIDEKKYAEILDELL